MPVQNPDSSDVAVGDATKAPDYNTLRDDVQQALRALDFGTNSQILAISPAVGDAALATDTDIFYVCLTAGLWQTIEGGGNIAVGRGHIDGLGYGVSGDTLTIELAAGAARSTDNVASIGFTSSGSGGIALTKDLAAVYADGEGNGMRDSADSISASKWFYLYTLLDDQGSKASDMIASTKRVWDGDTLILPTGFERSRYIGGIFYENATNEILSFSQRGDYFRFTTPVDDLDDASGTPGTFETVTLTVPGVEDGVIAHLAVRVHVGSGATAGIVRTPGAADSGVGNAVVVPGGAAEYVQVLTDKDGKVEYTILGGWSRILISVLGWEDQRGKNAS